MPAQVAPVATDTSGNAVSRLIRRTVTFYNDVVAEMRKVTWPDRSQLKDTTIKIIIFVLLLGAVIALIDLVMQSVLVRFIPSLFAGR
ncbi:MAG TPA: preprotein translocase subunit SecE [Candidatus Elarobacter sp.]|nr:preprotein translocase subunit SecE [Candidatus Elarobacter sp.]